MNRNEMYNLHEFFLKLDQGMNSVHGLPTKAVFGMETYGKEHSCGTVACFAGWTCILHESVALREAFVKALGEGRIQDTWVFGRAQQILELDSDQASELFLPAGWVLPSNQGGFLAKNAAEVSRLMIHYLDFTGKAPSAEWIRYFWAKVGKRDGTGPFSRGDLYNRSSLEDWMKRFPMIVGETPSRQEVLDQLFNPDGTIS